MLEVFSGIGTRNESNLSHSIEMLGEAPVPGCPLLESLLFEKKVISNGTNRNREYPRLEICRRTVSGRLLLLLFVLPANADGTHNREVVAAFELDLHEVWQHVGSVYDGVAVPVTPAK